MFAIKEDISSSMVIDPPDLKHLPGKSPAEKLTLLLQFISRWDTFPQDKGNRQWALNIFMPWIGHLYLEYFQYHVEEAAKIGEDYKPILDKLSSELIEDYYVAPFLSYIDYAYGEYFWPEACQIRTQMEAFHEMFGAYVKNFDTNGWAFLRFYRFIDLCRHHAIVLTEKEIPQNVPKSHWWWFYESSYRNHPFF